MLIPKLSAPVGPIEISNKTENSVDIKWKSPIHNGGASIKDYSIEYSTDDAVTWTNAGHVDGTTHNFSLKGLQEGEYYFKVTATNSKGLTSELKSEDLVNLIANIDITERKAFLEAIQSGLEERSYIRIQVIGKHGVGKSSLVRRLLNEKIDDVESTDGIDIIKKCEIRKSDGKWFVVKGGTERKEMIKRILRTVETKQKLKESSSGQALSLEGLSVDTEEVKNVKMIIPKSNETTPGISLFSKNYLIQREGGQTIQGILPANESNPNSGQNVLLDKRLLETETKQNQQDTIEIYKEQKTIADNRDNTERNEITKDHQNKALGPTMNDGRNDMTSNKNGKGSTVDRTGEKEKYKQKRKSSEITEEMQNKMIENLDQILSEVKKENEKKSSGDLVECGLWDFAGQKDYYVTHQTFLTPNAIYLIVTDLKEDIETRTKDEDFNYIGIGGHIEFWFDSIHCFCKDTSEGKLKPPVILVCTGTDKYEKEKRGEREREYKAQFNSIVGNKKKSNHRRNIFFISNKEFSGDDLNGLKDEISEIAKEMNYFAEELPTKWIKLENALSILKDFDINIRSWMEVVDLAEQNFIEKEDELLKFLKYQHKIGNIIFFEDIRDYIILQPNWLVKCFRCLVCDNHPLKVNDKLVCPTELNKLYSTGKLSEELIVQLFEKEPDLKFDKYKDHLLKVLEKFDIIIKPTFKRRDVCLKSYYMPCMISKKSKLVDIKDTFGVKEPHCSLTPWLVLEFIFLPLAYFNHILFDYITNYSICEVTTGNPAIYCGKAVFWLNKEQSNMLIVCFSQNAISLQIWKWDDVMNNTYTNVIDELLSKIEQLKEASDQKISYEIKAKCNLGNYADDKGRISLEKLNESKAYFCEEHKVMHNANEMTTTWFKAKKNQKKDCSKSAGQHSGKIVEDSLKHKGGNGGIQKTTAQHFEIPNEKKNFEFENYNQWDAELSNRFEETERLRYIKRLQNSQIEKRHYVNIMILGKQSVGKTSLLQNLLKKDIKDVSSIDGIDIVIHSAKINTENGKWIIEKDIPKETRDSIMDSSENLIMPSDLMASVFNTTSISNSPSNNYARCKLWDFAGQKEFYCTHQAFLTSSAIYLVVVDMKTNIVTEQKQTYTTEDDSFEDLHEEDYVGFWFDSIHCYRTVDQQDGEASMDPPVVVVFTGKDRYDQNELQERQKYLGDQLSQLQGEQERYQHYRQKYCISNTEDPDTIFEKIRTKISEIAQKMPLWGTLVPLKWILLEHLINIKRDSGKLFISFNDMTKMAEHPEIEIFDEGEVSTFLHFQNEVGNIIFFKDIPDLIILEPQWLANAFRCLVSDRFDIDDVHDVSPIDKRQISSDWTLLKNKGEISDLLINTLFKLKGGDYFLTQKKQLLEIMKKFDILIQIEGETAYIMPSMFPSSSLSVVCMNIGIVNANCQRTSWFCMKFKFLPPSFFSHLLVWLMKTYRPTRVKSEFALYRGICVFDLDSSQYDKLLMTMSIDTIALQIVSFSKQTLDLLEVCSGVRKDMRRKIVNLKKRYGIELSYEQMFKCSDCPCHTHAFSLKQLKDHTKIYCSHHQKAHESATVCFPWAVESTESHIEKDIKEKHSQILQTCSEHMVKNLYNVDMICEYLEVDDILTEEIRDTIKHKNGRQKQTKELLSILPFRGEKAYERFIEALKMTENTNVAHYLEQQVGSTG